jgi:uncharacterized protein
MNADIKTMLSSYKNIAVVGLSPDPSKPSNGVAAYLKRAGYRIFPVNPACDGEILGERCYASLDQIPEPVEIVDVFRRSEFVPEVVEQAIAKGAKVVWMQEGVINEAAAIKAAQAGLEVVMDRCILKEHNRLLGR